MIHPTPQADSSSRLRSAARGCCPSGQGFLFSAPQAEPPTPAAARGAPVSVSTHSQSRFIVYRRTQQTADSTARLLTRTRFTRHHKQKAMKGPTVAIVSVCISVQHKYCTAIRSGQFSKSQQKCQWKIFLFFFFLMRVRC